MPSVSEIAIQRIMAERMMASPGSWLQALYLPGSDLVNATSTPDG